MRLNRYLARSGVASRRQCDDLIRAGSISVNGLLVSELGCRVEVGADHVECRGETVELPVGLEYVALNKPVSYLVTRRDTQRRRTIYELVQERHPGTVAVGRLDLNTSGLLLLTNDGDLAYRLSHPRFKVEKHYVALVQGETKEATIQLLCDGVELEDGKTAPAKIELVDLVSLGDKVATRLRMTIREGRKRQIRRMCSAIGHEVLELTRYALGSLELGELPVGAWRHLEAQEVCRLRQHTGLPAEPA